MTTATRRARPRQSGLRPASRRIYRKWFSAAIVTGLASVAVAVAIIAAPAQASIGRCDSAQTVFTGVHANAHIWMPSSSSTSINCYMNRGETGQEVKALQMALNQCYGRRLSVDGQFGPRTQAALTEAQRTHGITSGLGRYMDRDAWTLRFWGVRGAHFVCAHMDGAILAQAR